MMCSSVLILFGLSLLTGCLVYGSSDEESISLPNSCLDLEDGTHWLKLLDDSEDTSYPPVNLECSNGYAILDYNRDTNIEKYFSSFKYWHYGVIGPAPGDRVNWQEWYLPFTDDTTYFALSPDCDSCEYDEDWQVYSTSTTYWMTGNTFQCWWSVKGVGECEMNYFTYECYQCSQWQDNEVTKNREAITYDETDPYVWHSCGECTHAVKPSFSKTPQTHDECQAYSFEGTFQPSLGIDGRYCTCTQEKNTQYYTMSKSLFNEYENTFNQLLNAKLNPQEITKTSENNIIELYQKDFLDGTYRIKEPGYYKIMEDIEFNFNSNENEHGFNDISNGWFPLNEQSNEYPGAGDYRDNYFLGFFAGITIESDDVILDLNEHELRQSRQFYYLQRWFSIIELASSMFLPGQGNGFFGNEFNVATNTVIKNGILGLTSHFGIHGNNNENIYIEDLQIRDFETHGIHMNWFINVNINNVEIGPASKIVYLKPEYGEARYLLPRLRKLADEYPDTEMQFYGRDTSVTMADIADELELQLEYAFWYAMNVDNIEELIDFTSDSWTSSKKLFINNEGMTSTSGLHGIFLNTIASPVLFTYRLSTEEYSKGATISNVKIHGLTHAMDEWIRFHHFGEEIWWNAFMGPIDARSAIDNIDSLDENIKYKGDIVIDSYIALNYLGYNNWDILGRQALGDGTLVNWALGTNTDLASGSKPYEIDIDNILLGCNCDAQLHSGKGVLGLRIDSVEDVSISNIEIYELEDSTRLGLKDCGAYSKFNIFDSDNSHRGGGHFVQRPPMQTGFSGNMVQALSIASSKNVIIENVYAHDLISHTGQTYGVSIWPGNDNVILKGNILTEYLHAGLEVDQETSDTPVKYNTLPNGAPEVCGTRVIYEYTKESLGTEDSTTYVTSLTIDDDANINTQCVTGIIGCEGSFTSFSTIGDTSENDENCRDPISAIDSLDTILKENGKKVIMSNIAMGDSESNQYSWQKTQTTASLLDAKKLKQQAEEVVDNELSVHVKTSEKKENISRIFGLTKLEFGSLISVFAMCSIFGIYILFLRHISDNPSKNKLYSSNKAEYISLKPAGNGNYGAV